VGFRLGAAAPAYRGWGRPRATWENRSDMTHVHDASNDAANLRGDQELAIIQIKNCLLVSIQTELHDRLALNLQAAIMERVRAVGAKGIILDVSAVEIIDSYITRILNDIGKSVRYMGAECYIVGIRPAVAMTLIEMGVELDSVNTALNLDLALEKLELLQ
jgi:rsbT antagonist protein RsbS